MKPFVTCPVCGSNAPCDIIQGRDIQCFHCTVCGEFEWGVEDHNHPINLNQLAAYLIYHKIVPSAGESRYHTTLSKELCDRYCQEFHRGNNICGLPIHIDSEMIENWYPRTFAEKINYILLYIYNHAPHIGQAAHFMPMQFYSFLFLDRYEVQGGKYLPREERQLQDEGSFMLECLAEKGLIKNYLNMKCNAMQNIILTPVGYARIDELQKNNSYGRTALVAMKFGEDTKPLREAIRSGVERAGYIAVFIDEVQHNDLITPELLKHIRDSKFVVVDLTHKNNGAYFEEGYAMGLGKVVIQLCKKGTCLHFDVAQKNTIMWDTEDAIPDLLFRRIKATID